MVSTVAWAMMAQMLSMRQPARRSLYLYLY